MNIKNVMMMAAMMPAFALAETNSNPDLKWEVKKTFDVGFDLSMFKQRLNVTFDWYTSETSDMLYTYI